MGALDPIDREETGPPAGRTVVARHVETGRWVRLRTEGGTIAEAAPRPDPDPDPDQPAPGDEWIAPAFWDIQVNGRGGVSFSDPTLTEDQVAEIVRAQASLGTARLCPTLITAPREVLLRAVTTIASACARDPEVGRRVLGIHLEGPYIAPEEGYRGAHPLEAVRDPDWAEFEALWVASGARIALVTLAPERPGAIEFIRRAVALGVVVALGHTAAGAEALREGVEAGATLSTHLGNGIAATLPRHPNALWQQAADDRLTASLIADGHHLDRDTLRVLARAKGPRRVVLVSDASPLAGLPPGRYGAWAVDPSGRVVVAGTPYLAGSNRGLEVGIGHLIAAGLSPAEALATATTNPALLLGRPAPRLDPGEPADLIRYRLRGRSGFELVATCVGGAWSDPGNA